ncbi:MAG: flagellar hook-basal body complex protein FliE [Legionellales bacterium]
MKIDALSNLFLIPKTPTSELTEQPIASFANWLGDKLGSTNEQLNAADHALTQLATGNTQSLHQTMLTLEQAKLSFQYLEQIRNRLMSAYQELLREQI